MMNFSKTNERGLGTTRFLKIYRLSSSFQTRRAYFKLGFSRTLVGVHPPAVFGLCENRGLLISRHPEKPPQYILGLYEKKTKHFIQKNKNGKKGPQKNRERNKGLLFKAGDLAKIPHPIYVLRGAPFFFCRER